LILKDASKILRIENHGIITDGAGQNPLALRFYAGMPLASN
jgi:hypothetical protein